MVNKIILICLTALILNGCSFFKHKKVEPVTIIKTQEVLVPVNECPVELKSVQKPERPKLLIDLLTEKDEAGKVVQYYKGSVQQLMNYIDELEGTIKIYRNSCN